MCYYWSEKWLIDSLYLAALTELHLRTTESTASVRLKIYLRTVLSKDIWMNRDDSQNFCEEEEERLDREQPYV